MTEHSFIYLLLKTALALTVVVLLIFAIFFILKKAGYKPLSAGNGSKIQVLEKRFLAPKQYLAHIEWEGYKFLIGICQNQITVIKEVENTSSTDDL